jgi:hypothetical protein
MKCAMSRLFILARQYWPVLFVTLFCVLAIEPAAPAWAQDLRLPNGRSIKAADLPYYRNRPKILGFLQKANHNVAVAATPKFCPEYSYTLWSSSDHPKAIRICDQKNQEMLSDYPAAFRKMCACKLLVKDMVVTDVDLIMSELRYTTFKLYLKAADGAVRTVRGVLEFEKASLDRQSIRILNQNKDEICKGSMTPSLGDDGAFELSCFNGKRHASGSVLIPEIFYQYALGSGVFENGEVFAFIARLTDEEIKSRYPNFPDVREEVADERNDGG